MKLTLPGKVQLRVSVWLHGTPKQLLMHVQAVINAVRQKGLLKACKKACTDKKVCIKMPAKVNEVLQQ